MKLKYCVCDFTKPSYDGYYVDKKSVIDLMNTDNFKSKMKNQNTMGAISHKVRYDIENSTDYATKTIPISDFLLESGQAANYTSAMYLDGDKLIAELTVLSNDAGSKMQKMIKEDGLRPEVSMSTECRVDEEHKKYIITDFYGVDFTLDPALSTELIKVDFSVKREGNFSKFMKKKTEKVCFSAPVLSMNFDEEAIEDETAEVANDEIVSEESPEVLDAENPSVEEVVADDGTNEVLSEMEMSKEDKVIESAKNIKEKEEVEILTEPDVSADTSEDSNEDDLLIDDIPVISDGSDNRLVSEYLTGFGPLDDTIMSGQNFSKKSGRVHLTKSDFMRTHFSVSEYINEQNQSPRDIMNEMINDFVNYINNTSLSQLAYSAESALNYIRDYLYDYITEQINSGSSYLNLIVGLGLDQYDVRESAEEFQNIANDVSSQLKSSGTIDQGTQKRFSESFAKFFSALIVSIITSKVEDQDKVALFIKPVEE